MEISLETIYRQVAAGTLSKADALAMIRARNLRGGAGKCVSHGFHATNHLPSHTQTT